MIKKELLHGLTEEGAGDVLVVWSEQYATGIKVIDDQHMELVNLTNELYQACLISQEKVKAVFKDVMDRMVEYVRFHFTTEMNLLKEIQFPGYNEHKKQHDELIINILNSAKEYDEGKRFVPNNFARTLKDWIFGHIAVYDPVYALYAQEQRKKGLLPNIEFDNLRKF